MTPAPDDPPDDYLWDRSGPPDPDVVRLERALGEHRARPVAGADPAADPARGPTGPSGRTLVRFTFRVAVAATLLLAILVGVAWLVRGRDPSTLPAAPGRWVVASIEGAPTVGARALSGEGRADAGETLVTDARSRARIDVAELGHVEVGPDSRVRLLATGDRGHRLALDRGRLSALTWAPPRRFFVETPTAVAADLGCSFTLDVDDAGASVLTVTTGWVAFERGGIEAIVPAGAECRAKAGVGPGTPVFSDAPPALGDALRRFDFEGGHAEDLDRVLQSARPKDTLSVWHVLVRVPAADRPRVYDRLRSLAPPPVGVTRDAVLALDKTALEAWREALRAGW